eukprot:TRINITY_DN4413_c0_g2_i2.p1 TRINITY_DN4413_c0_g2~~TRINITY_DN4413_c0_g2_i2.p1  ORF type:complete len:331 (-),score=29.42 TRINITY_DN4413_c0_g2_i2:408-1400(-)
MFIRVCEMWKFMDRDVRLLLLADEDERDRSVSLRRRLARAFVDNHPFLSVFYASSIELSGEERCFLLSVKIFGALFVSALFFAQSSEGSGCERAVDIGEQIGEALPASIASAIIGTIPEIWLLKIHTYGRTVRSRSSVSIADVLRFWHYRRWALRFVEIAYVCFCFLFCASFLANSNAADGGKWILACLFTLALTFFIKPFIISCVLVLLIVQALHYSRKKALIAMVRSALCLGEKSDRVTSDDGVTEACSKEAASETHNNEHEREPDNDVVAVSMINDDTTSRRSERAYPAPASLRATAQDSPDDKYVEVTEPPGTMPSGCELNENEKV